MNLLKSVKITSACNMIVWMISFQNMLLTPHAPTSSAVWSHQWFCNVPQQPNKITRHRVVGLCHSCDRFSSQRMTSEWHHTWLRFVIVVQAPGLSLPFVYLSASWTKALCSKTVSIYPLLSVHFQRTVSCRIYYLSWLLYLLSKFKE